MNLVKVWPTWKSEISHEVLYNNISSKYSYFNRIRPKKADVKQWTIHAVEEGEGMGVVVENLQPLPGTSGNENLHVMDP